MCIRDETAEKRIQMMQLQTELSVQAQRRLQAESRTEQLGLELQLMKKNQPADLNAMSSAKKDTQLNPVRLLTC